MINACSSVQPDSLSQQRPVVVAHRGGASLGMENSLSCIEKGIAAGADMVEIDVHLTADGEVVVCHDATIDRTTNGEGRIEELTLEQIQSFRLLDADGKPSDETVPTLSEVLQLLKSIDSILMQDSRKSGHILLLEIKKKENQYVGIEQKVLDLLMYYDMVDRTIVQSFNEPVLETIHQICPSIRLELLSFVPPARLGKYPYIASFNTCRYFTSRRFVKRAHKQGKEVKIWTVETPCRATRLPVDGIITNDPALFGNNEK